MLLLASGKDNSKKVLRNASHGHASLSQCLRQNMDRENLSRYSDSLRAGRSGYRIPVGVRFSAPVQTGPGAHPASCTMGTGSFPGLKRPGRGVDHPLSSSAEVKERVGFYLYSTSGPLWYVLGWTLHLVLLAQNRNFVPCSAGRVQLKCDGTRWRTGGEVKGKLANGVGSQ